MPDDRVSIDNLTTAPDLGSNDVLPVVHEVSGVKSTYKTSLTALSSFANKELQYSSDLHTTSKTIIGAINELEAGGGGGGSSTLAGLSDVDIDDQTLSNGQVLKYDSTEDKWVNDNVGAGGHTIVDDGGTSLTQRTKLQFIGAYTEDNSQDNTTEVNVARAMTKAQFDLLSAAEKVGIINVTDETSVPLHNYSTTEQVVGTWIDGSTIYEKTFTSSTYYYSTAVALVDLSSFSFDKIIDFEIKSVLTISGEGNMYFSPTGDNGYMNTDKKIYARQSLAASQSGRTMQSYITVRYTKASS